MKSRSTGTWKIVQLPEDQCVGSTRILQPDECWSPTTGSNAGKHKAGDNVHTYDELPFLEDSGGGGGSVTSDDVSNESNVSGATVTDALNALASSSTPADLPYTYTNATSGDPTSGKIGFNTTTPASINSVRISFTDGNGVSQSGLVSQLNTTGGTMLFRWSGGSLVLRIGSSSGSFGSWASYDATYVSGTLPADGTAMSVDVGLYAADDGPITAVYTLSGLASDPPTIDYSRNELGGTPTWVRDADGRYTYTNTGNCPVGRTQIFVTVVAETGVWSTSIRDISVDGFTIRIVNETGTGADPDGLMVEIKVNPA